MKKHISFRWIAECLLVVLLAGYLSVLISNLIIYSKIREVTYKIHTDLSKVNPGGPMQPAEICYNGQTYGVLYMDMIDTETTRGSKLLSRDIGKLINNSGSDFVQNNLEVYELKGISPNIAVAVKLNGLNKCLNRDYSLKSMRAKITTLSISSIILMNLIVVIYLKFIRRKYVNHSCA